MTAHVSIGEFSRLSHLPVKTLRYYHDIDLLVPRSVDSGSGYRRYSTDQVADALLIRRLRALDMPVPQVRDVVTAVDDTVRSATLQGHLRHMESELVRTQRVVASLRSLLDPTPRLDAVLRSVEPQSVLAVRAVVRRNDIEHWCGEAFPRLYRTATSAGTDIVGPGGATYSTDFFEQDEGEVVAFVPTSPGVVVEGLDVTVLPGGTFAVAVHHGPFREFDRTYGALGAYVAEHHVALPDPIREVYLVGPDSTADELAFRTEVCWPVRAA